MTVNQSPLRTALLAVLYRIDYTRQACTLSEQVGECLPSDVLEFAHYVLEQVRLDEIEAERFQNRKPITENERLLSEALLIPLFPERKPMTDNERLLRKVLVLVLDNVDYMRGACAITEMVGACLPAEILDLAHDALEQTAKDDDGH
jgi:hypothetical protein